MPSNKVAVINGLDGMEINGVRFMNGTPGMANLRGTEPVTVNILGRSILKRVNR